MILELMEVCSLYLLFSTYDGGSLQKCSVDVFPVSGGEIVAMTSNRPTTQNNVLREAN